MKKLLISGLFLFMVASISAQTKITKKDIVGKWVTAAVEIKDMFYYNAEKDSLSISTSTRERMKDAQQLTAAIAMMKPQLAMFAKTFFTFNPNGTAELGTGIEPAIKAKYVVDEINSTITTVDPNKKEDVLNAMMQQNLLRILIKQPEGDMILFLKKSK